MIKVLFVCHGNICRSVMAEFMLKDYVKNKGVAELFLIDSKAVSREEIGNDMYYAAKKCLDYHHIPYQKHQASQVSQADYLNYDYIFLMDESNQRRITTIINNDKENKISLFLKDHSIADPWYSGDFETTYQELTKGIEDFIAKLETEGKLV